jgi:hypothetical protein
MADDINKTINIQVDVNTDGLQQIDKYKVSFDSLRDSISGLGKPLTDVAANINGLSKSVADTSNSLSSLNKDILQVQTAIQKAGEDSKKAQENTKPDETKTKNLLGRIFNLFVKHEADKSKTTTDANTKTNTAIEKNTTDLQKKIGEKAYQMTQDIEDATYRLVSEGINAQADLKIKRLKDAEKKELSNASLTAEARANIEKGYQTKVKNAKNHAFREQQKADMAQAIINGAVAVTKVTAQSGILAPVMIAGVIANTAVQVAKIAAQKPPALAKGGYFHSDGKGAILSGYSRMDDTNAYLRSGEAVIVSEAMRDPWARNLVSAINVAYGGRDFSVPNLARGYAVGGIFTDGGNANRYYNQPVNDQKNLANTVAYQMINNFPPVYVDVKDVNNQQNILAQTINRVNL